jgi:hypothetical protein
VLLFRIVVFKLKNKILYKIIRVSNNKDDKVTRSLKKIRLELANNKGYKVNLQIK